MLPQKHFFEKYFFEKLFFSKFHDSKTKKDIEVQFAALDRGEQILSICLSQFSLPLLCSLQNGRNNYVPYMVQKTIKG